MLTKLFCRALWGLVGVCLAVGACLRAQDVATPAAAALPPLNLAAVENVQLLANPGFEQSDKSWHFSDWPPRPGSGDSLTAASIVYSSEVVHTGRQALGFDHSTIGPERLLGIRQVLKREQLAPYDGRRLRLSAWFWLAKGPPYYQGTLGMRQWNALAPGPFGGVSLPIGGSRGEWLYGAKEFEFRLADTQRADVNLWLPNVPDTTQAPRVFVDDVRLEVLADPPLRVELLCGATVFQPDDRLPVRVEVAESVWRQALVGLRWNVTPPAGLRSLAEGDLTLAAPRSLTEVRLPSLPPGRYALRLALGRTVGERTHEVLIPFRRAVGPFAP